MHGMGSSHITWLPKPGQADLKSLCPGVRLVILDRPGYGNSDNPPLGYSYSQWADDLAQLADSLNMPRFCVVGHSSGGPYALAAAAVLKDRVLACGSVSGDPPYAHPEAKAIADDMLPNRGFGVDPKTKFAGWRKKTLEGGNPAKVPAWKVGEYGFLMDYQLERLPWSFALESIKLGNRVTFWVGEKDFEAIAQGAPWMKERVEGSQLVVVPGGDHGFKSNPEHLKAILSSLREQAKAALA